MSYNLTAIVGTGNESSMLTFTQGVNTVLMHDMLGINDVVRYMVSSIYISNGFF